MAHTRPDGIDYNQNYKKRTKTEEPANRRKGTVIQGDNEMVDKDDIGQNQLMGFLVSYSQIGKGEFWVLREGNKNIIGKASSCSIQLKEQTVSDQHAIINIRRSRDETKKLMVVITDTNSANGTVVNGVDIGINGHINLKQFDRIKIGNYDLMVIIVDKIAQKLELNPNFKATADVFDYSSKGYYQSNQQNNNRRTKPE